jgi:NAD(P)-dependent dehydrogenase (short-subunit alcohol dehydrogenase family)
MEDYSMGKRWLVTGGGRGLGRAIVETALAAGHNILATARDTDILKPLVQKYGDQLGTFALDVRDEAGVLRAANEVVERFGGIDVLVNNAGYGHFEAFEQKTSDRFREEIETNFFGVVNMTRAVLPLMRAQRFGHIFNVSSVGGRVGTPGLTAYQAAKWAVGGFTEVLRSEVAHLGIKVVALEPGGMRTGWAETAGYAATAQVLDDYVPSVGQTVDRIRAYAGSEVGDPAKIAALVLALSERSDLPTHLVLGTDALFVFDNAETTRRAEHERWLSVSKSTVFGAPEGEEIRALGELDQECLAEEPR